MILDLGLSEYAVSVQCGENGSFTERVDTFIHTRNRTWVFLGNVVKFAVDDAKLNSLFLLGDEHYESCPFRLYGLGDIFG